ALYAGTQRIVSLQQAIARLGFQEIRKISLSIAIINSFKNSFIDYEKFWLHSITTAYITVNLAKRTKTKIDEEEIFSSALLHDVGVLILDQYFGGLYKKVFDIAAKKKFDLQIVEQKILGITHAEVAAILLKKWRLPDSIINVILNHHTPQNSPSEQLQMTQFVYLANFISNNRGIDNGTGFFPEQFYDDIWEDLNLSVDDIPDILDSIEDELKHAKELLRIGGR
ncbi:MAG: HDOD domain-containing protein, partial [Candidatus Cloacimonadota bacterium]|nr:HDOD domain-containing protein [Candidatus Cloacimonadota bacterium]